MNIHKMFPKMFPAMITFDTTLSKVLNVAFPQLEVQPFNDTTVIVKFPTTDSDLIMGISVDVTTYVGDLNVKLGGTFFEVKSKNIGVLIDIAGSIYRTYVATNHFLSTFVRSRIRKIKFLSALTNNNSDYTARFDKTFSEFVVVTRFAEFCEVAPSHLSNIAFLEMFFKAKMDADFLTESAVNLMVESVVNTVSLSDPDVCTVVDSCEPYIMELLSEGKPNHSDNVLNSLDSLEADLEKIESWVRENFNTISETKSALIDFYDLDEVAHKRLSQAKTYPMLAKFILDFIIIGEDEDEDEDEDAMDEEHDSQMYAALDALYIKDTPYDEQSACIDKFFGSVDWWRVRHNIDAADTENRSLMMTAYLNACPYGSETDPIFKMVTFWLNEGF